MTNLYLPRLRAHALSAPVGSGKTRAAIAWMSSPATVTRNVLYVAPTRALVDQTARGLREALAAASPGIVRNVHLIHRENTTGPVQVEALDVINQVEGNEGQVQLITTVTFLAIVARIKRPELWSVVLDEAFDPATFTSFRLGADTQRGWDHFAELFTVDPEQGYRILPREGRRTLVEEIAQGNYRNAGDRFVSLESVARAVANPAIRCELVMTDDAQSLVNGAPLKARPRKNGADHEAASAVLQFSSYVDPAAFAGFREVLFLSALFEQTILYHLWTRALGVTFEEHPEFPAELLRDTHLDQGRFLAVGHLLHKEDNASLENLKREALTGKREDAKPGGRVIDYLVQTASTHFSSERFLLQTNQRFGFTEGAACVPRNATVIPAYAHGRNDFDDIDNVAALCVTNPNKQQAAWIRTRTGLKAREVTRSYRIHTVYQALGRCSIRKADPSSTPKVVLTVGIDDARFLESLFPGSHWLGQVGTMPRLDWLETDQQSKAPGKIERIALAILRHLEGIDEGASKVSSRALKAAVERHCLLLIDKGSDGEVCIPQQTWTAAVSRACVVGSGWQRQGQSLRRVSAELYGFEPSLSPFASQPSL